MPATTLRPPSSPASPADAPRAVHVVDTTMFWSLTGGGVRRYLCTKHDWLRRQPGWRHSIAVPRAAGAIDADPPTTRLPALPLPGSGGYRLPLRRAAVARVLGAMQPDLIEAGDPYRVAWAALDAARQRGVPAVAYCHSNLEAMARLAAGARFAGVAGRAARRYARHLYGHFDLVLAPSRSMCGHLADWGVARVACQPLGVDSAAFHPSRASAAWREAHGIEASTRLLVYAGRFAPEKHLDVLADAVSRLGDGYALFAIGAGPAPPHGERVRVLPFLAGTGELATALASADAFVHAGDQETFGLAALEAMACGTPVVARSAEGLAELVDERVGQGVATGTGTAFAEAIAAVCGEGGSGGSREARGAAARARAEAHDWQRVLPGLLGHYRRLLGRAAAPVVVSAGSEGSAAVLPSR